MNLKCTLVSPQQKVSNVIDVFVLFFIVDIPPRPLVKTPVKKMKMMMMQVKNHQMM